MAIRKGIKADLTAIENVVRQQASDNGLQPAEKEQRSNVATQKDDNAVTDNADNAATYNGGNAVTDVVTSTDAKQSDEKITYCSITIKIDADLMERLDYIKHKFKRETVKTNKRDKQDVISAAIEDFLLKYWDEKNGLTKEGYDRVGEYLRGVRKV